MSPPSLSLRIQHRFGPRFALDVDVTFDAPTIALSGPSGSGKTSVLTAIAGLWTPSTARIVVGEAVLVDTAAGVSLASHRRRVGYVPQQSLLFPLLSVRDNLEFGRPTNTTLSTSDVAAALEIDHLLPRRPRLLSGGERQRVALGRAVLSEPAILVCDEPFSALDSARRDRLLRVLLQWRATLQIPLVLVSHQLDEVRALDGEVAVLDSGRARATGRTASP